MSHLTNKYWDGQQKDIKRFGNYLYSSFPEPGIEMQQFLKKFDSKYYSEFTDVNKERLLSFFRRSFGNKFEALRFEGKQIAYRYNPKSPNFWFAAVFEVFILGDHVIAYVFFMTTLSEQRRKGIAHEFLADLLQGARQATMLYQCDGAFTMAMCSPVYRPFYQKCNFVLAPSMFQQYWAEKQMQIMMRYGDAMAVDACIMVQTKTPVVKKRVQNQGEKTLAKDIGQQHKQQQQQQQQQQEQVLLSETESEKEDEEEEKSAFDDDNGNVAVQSAQQFKSPAKINTVKLRESLLKKDRDETESVAGSVSAKSSMSVLTGKSKCGATNKHCTVGGCTYKKAIDGSHWARHVKVHTNKGMAKESVSFVHCLGEICDLCPSQGQVDTVSRHGAHKLMTCSVCGETKTSESFIKLLVPIKCKACYRKEQTMQTNTTPTTDNSNNINNSNSNSNSNNDNNSSNSNKGQPLIASNLHQLPVAAFSLGKRTEREGEQQDNDNNDTESIGHFLQQHGDNDGDIYMHDETMEQQQQQQQQQQEFEVPAPPLTKRQKTGDEQLTVAIHNTLISSSAHSAKDEQESIVPHNSLSSAGSVYVVALTDDQALTKLKDIEASNKIKGILRQDLLKICEQFTQDLLLEYISRGEHQLVSELLAELLDRPEQLNEQRMLGMMMFSYILGGACWNNAAKLISGMEKVQRESFMDRFDLHVTKRFSPVVAKWSCQYYKYIEQQQFKLISYMRDNKIEVDERLLMISFAVQLNDIADFVEFTNLFLEVPAAELLVSCVRQRSKQQKISVDDYIQLAEDIQRSSIYTLINNNKEEFISTPLCEWKALIDKYQAQAAVVDAESIQKFIDELIEKYGEIQDEIKNDLTQNEDCMLGMIVHTIVNSPNKRQLALAQYCVGKLYQASRQLWVVPSGQGKSRIAAASAAIALMTGAFNKVHIVFDNKHLMKRDQADFEDLWTLLSYESNVEYKVGCNFTPAKGELVIIDEADTFMFNDTENFIKLVNESACLCFTATPDNCDEKGAEAKIINALGFKKYEYMIEPEYQSAAIATLQEDETVKAATIEEKAAYIKEQLATSPVLVFGGADLTEEIKKLGCDCVVVTEDIDPAFLRSLDEQHPYKVLIVEGEFGTRGIDYRCQQAKMTLVIAKSFVNKREAMQGLSRVGRFGDDCKRARFADTKLVDDKASLKYTAKLFACIMKLQKNTVALKPIHVEAMTKSFTQRQKQLLGLSKKQAASARPTPTQNNASTISQFFAKQDK